MNTDELANVAATASRGGRHLVLQLEENQYAVPIHTVREIIAMHDITPLPHMPQSVRGVINLRGRIIPVADLRVCLQMMPTESTESTCIIVADLEQEEDGTVFQIGYVVDSVCEVRDFAEENIQAAPRSGAGEDHLQGLIRSEETVVGLLDIKSLLGQLALNAGELH